MNAKPLTRRWWLGLAALAALTLLIAILLPRSREQPRDEHAGVSGSPEVATGLPPPTGSGGEQRTAPPRAVPPISPDAVVRGKVAEFTRNRRDLLHKFAEHLKLSVPADADQLFGLIEAGDWEAATALFKSLELRKEDQPEALRPLWPVISETYWVAKIARDWPAQALLDYGQAVLGALRPGMVYVGGTDAGRFIPTLLNETSAGERHIILTQNQLADATYLEYARFLYGERLALFSPEDSQRGFSEYLQDLQRRARHDADFPHEPRQLRFGEEVQWDGSRLRVSGAGAVMAINEALLQMILAKNPDASFALEQSFPFTSVYSNAVALGPILELRVTDPERALTAQKAAETADYWQRRAATLALDPGAPEGSPPRLAWSKLAAEQAALLLHHNYVREAEQTFQISCQLCPYSDAVPRYAEWLAAQNRRADALSLLQTALRTMPETREFDTVRAWDRDVLERLSAEQNP